MNVGGFSWRRALGFSAAKAALAAHRRAVHAQRPAAQDRGTARPAVVRVAAQVKFALRPVTALRSYAIVSSSSKKSRSTFLTS